MTRSAAALCAVLSFAVSVMAAQRDDAIRLEVKETLTPGARTATFAVYATRDGGSPLAIESLTVFVDANGSIVTPLAGLFHFASSDEDRWISVRVDSGSESSRMKLNRIGSPPATVHVVTDAAITANGIIESIASGFRFPDGSVQTSAATVTSPGYGSPVAISTSNANGVATTVARSDHVHAHGNLPGGTLHSAATTGTAGFLSASDKSKLDSTAAYVRTVVVSPTVGNATASGTALVNALNGIAGNSSSNPYLLKIEPGVYNIGSSALTMKSYVDIEGSGENTTFITAARGSASDDGTAAAVIGAPNSEIRDLTITNTAAATKGIGLYTADSVKVRNVTINSTGGTTYSYGILTGGSSTVNLVQSVVTATGVGGSSYAFGLYSANSLTVVQSSTVTAKSGSGNYGIYAQSVTNVYVDSSTIIGTGSTGFNTGVQVQSGFVSVLNSTVRVDTTATRTAAATANTANARLLVYHSLLWCFPTGPATEKAAIRGTGSTLRIGASQLDGATSGTPTCVHAYDGTFAVLTTCT